jgi:hypothetical protein
MTTLAKLLVPASLIPLVIVGPVTFKEVVRTFEAEID